MSYRQIRPFARCPFCDRILMPAADGTFRKHVRYLKSKITQASRPAFEGNCRGSGRPAMHEVPPLPPRKSRARTTLAANIKARA